ncbi:MAG: hypothetical protein ACFFH0_11430, partial [Promethearchaeota archaeon]
METRTASKVRCAFFITLLLTSAYPIIIGHATSSQEEGGIVAFSSNLLLSTNDSQYAHHVEVSVAISENGTLFAGW